MKLLKKIDHNILSLLGMYAVVLIAMAILNPSTYYSTLNIKSWFFLFPEYGILTFGMMPVSYTHLCPVLWMIASTEVRP